MRFTCASALPALPLLGKSLGGNTLTLTWANSYCVLQQASILTGALSDWVDVPAASSPFSVNTTASPARYYRLRY